jgi:hypothetical protein
MVLGGTRVRDGSGIGELRPTTMILLTARPSLREPSLPTYIGLQAELPEPPEPGQALSARSLRLYHRARSIPPRYSLAACGGSNMAVEEEGICTLARLRGRGRNRRAMIAGFKGCASCMLGAVPTVL